MSDENQKPDEITCAQKRKKPAKSLAEAFATVMPKEGEPSSPEAAKSVGFFIEGKGIIPASPKVVRQINDQLARDSASFPSEPQPAQEIVIRYEAPPTPTRLAFCIPMSRRLGSCELNAFAGLFDPAKMELMTENRYDVFVNRNRLAARFLASPHEWSFWMDDDMVPPFGNAQKWRLATGRHDVQDAYAGMHAIGKLLTTGHKMVSGMYFGRDARKQAIWSTPRRIPGAYESVLRSGPRNEIQGPEEWVGMGCCLIHRKIFEDIIAKVPDIEVKNLAAKPWLQYRYGFFDKIDDASDDVSFCNRVRQSGNQIFCDLSVMAAHMGDHAYTNL